MQGAPGPEAARAAGFGSGIAELLDVKREREEVFHSLARALRRAAAHHQTQHGKWGAVLQQAEHALRTVADYRDSDAALPPHSPFTRAERELDSLLASELQPQTPLQHTPAFPQLQPHSQLPQAEQLQVPALRKPARPPPTR